MTYEIKSPDGERITTVIILVSLSNGISEIFLNPVSFPAVTPPFAALISRAVSVGSPLTVHSLFFPGAHLSRLWDGFSAEIDAVVQNTEHLRSSLRGEILTGLILLPLRLISPSVLFPFPETSYSVILL